MAVRRAEGEERLPRPPERLGDLRHHVDRALHERAVLRLGNFDDEGAGHGVAVGIEGDRAAEGGLEAEPGEGRAQATVPLAWVAAGFLESEKQGLGVDVVGQREEARRRACVGEALTVALREGGPGFVVLALGDRQRRDRTQQQGTDGVVGLEQAAVEGRRARHDGGLPPSLAIGFEEVLGNPGGQREEERVRLGKRDGLGDAHGVARAGGDPVPVEHLAAEGAVVQHESQELRIGQGIVLDHRHDRAEALLLVGIAPEPRDPLHAVGVEAEEVPGRCVQRGLLSRRSAVDERHLGHALRQFADRDALDPGEGSDDDAGTPLDQHDGLGDHGVRRSVGGLRERFDAQPPGASLVLLHGQLVAAQGVLAERGERAFEGGEHADL